MSYGYLVVSTSPISELQKHRRFKFSLIESCDDFFAYSRLEESDELTIRQGEKSLLTSAGKDFFSSMPKPFFLMDYLLTKKQSEMEVIDIAKSNLKTFSFRRMRITAGEELYLNCLYEVRHD